MTMHLLLLGVMLLSGPDDVAVDRATGMRIAAEAETDVSGEKTSASAAKNASITACRSDFDREEGVAMFEKDVCVTYSTDYVLHADRLFVFLGGSNELSRIVALGGVTITNETRVGTCSKARFWRKTNEIELFGDAEADANLVDGTDGSSITGSRIRFWLDAQQVEVENSRLGAENHRKGGLK